MKTTSRILSLTLAVVIAVGAFAVPMRFGLQPAFAAESIDTSADDHGKKFFGNSLLQVLISDDSKDDSDTVETISPDIEVRDNTGTLVTTLSPDIDETGDDTSTFEWYITKAGSTIEPQDPENDAGDTSSDNFLDDSQPLAEGWSLKIIYKGQSTTITYDDQPATVGVDRETAYGSDNLLYLSITDQDANADPTNRDVILTDDAFVEMSGDEDHAEGIVCRETGDNTAEFECTYQIGTGEDLDPGADNEAAVSFTIRDQSQYMANTGPVIDETDAIDLVAETATDDITISIEDNDGDLGPISQVSTSTELPLTLTDADRNINSKDEDTIDSDAGTWDPTMSLEDLVTEDAVGVIVYIDAGDADADFESVPMTETEDGSGVFTPDLPNDQLKVSFLADDETATPDNGILEFRASDTDEDIVIAYVDPKGTDGDDQLASSITTDLKRTPGTIDVTESAGINSDFTLTLTDPDLNDNSKTRDSYTLRFDGTGDGNNEFAIERAGDPIGDLATLEVQIEGDAADFDDELTYTLTETGANTGIFTAKLDMEEILSSTGADVDDGDSLEFTYHDYMGDTEREDSATLTIGRAESAVDLSRDELPIPPAPTGVTADALGSEEVVINLSITDPDMNTQSGSQDTLTLDLGTNMVVEVDGDGFSGTLDADDDEITGGVELQDILAGGLDGLTLKETGPNTGVFEEDLVFTRGDPTDLDLDEWQDMRLTFVYTDSQDEENSAGFTFRGHDSAVSVDKTTVSPSDVLTITVQDEDLNLDDSNIEEFDCSFSNDDMLALEAEDDDIDNAGSCPTFTETGENTGIFVGTVELGEDITTIDTAAGDQASNIHITYNEEVDSSGEEPDQTEIDVPIATATGAIQISPDLVGPGTEITVHIIDTDLNETPNGRDTVDADEGTLVFRSDRTEVGRSSVDMEETGPATGVFAFTIQLETDASDCADDDLGDDKYNADFSGDEGTIGACPGDLISIRYDDNQDANGHSTTVSKVVEVKSWDPEFATDKESYNVGDRVTVSISDPDANTDADVADTLRDIRVYSDTDQVGETVSAIETGKDTGVFKLSTTLSATSQSGGVEVKSGDQVTVQYTDDFPADFTDNEEDKDFKFTFEVGGGPSGTGATTPTAPTAKDVTGKLLTSVNVGQQVVLSTTIKNNNVDAQTFAGIIEVRDSSGVTVFLGWSTGKLTGNGDTSIGLSWTPEEAGSYQVRTFVISDLVNPQILSAVQTSTISVS